MKKRTDQSNLTIPPLNDACRKRLRQLREHLGLSRPKFADMLGIPPTTLKNYELNYREISGGTLLLIAQHPELSAHFTWLTTGQGKEPVKLETSE
ncbi:helix-turn-helix transcriptional regulator [Aeromonas hydrophila]|uniref:Transcriptional protein n=2 Tax=Aeromonas hydrophila TaxID=644 RepID=Q5VJ05_AERHY|nr:MULTISPECIES: helix-turn-helix transcriptional regulator [Aeromonas]KMK94485.1 XRE family transcriptional regulator [Aeromonas enteropelogenes]AAS46724.1 transcriptional protein [Aeromonas hydrophila]AJE36325.1 XRE family transcriptional regulator [Aeromonas hydrophila J-1]AKJ34585.1 XRE family transcriptional regulator [Aeromonas hydrophila NJ-35]ALQ63422.1 XRE family transcriptional regulator [Aeromonas hydrophila]